MYVKLAGSSDVDFGRDGCIVLVITAIESNTATKKCDNPAV